MYEFPRKEQIKNMFWNNRLSCFRYYFFWTNLYSLSKFEKNVGHVLGVQIIAGRNFAIFANFGLFRENKCF